MLKATRQAGFGVALDEGEPGTAAVAVAVVDASAAGAAVGTLSLAGPLSRFDPERRSFFVARLHSAAQELGGIWPLRHHRAMTLAPPQGPAKTVRPRLSNPHVRSRTPVL
jgi:hypothetical protein